MSRTQQEKIKYLRVILTEVSKYREANAYFVRQFNKRTKTNQYRNFVNRVLAGVIKFERGLFDYLDIAIQVAEETLKKYKKKRESETRSIPLRQFIDKGSSAGYIYEQIQVNDILLDRGNVNESADSINGLYDILAKDKFKKATPYTFGLLNLLLGKIHMQLGVNEGDKNTLLVVGQSISIFEKLGENEKLIRAFNIQAHAYRQLGSYDLAMEIFSRNDDLIKSSYLSKDDKVALSANMKLQTAISLMRKSEQAANQSMVEHAEKLFKRANRVYRDFDNESWRKLSLMREAELYVKHNKIHAADKILGDFEDYCEIATLETPKRSIFFRINTEKYLKVRDIENAIKNFKAAVAIALNEGYKNELKHLRKLYRKYALLNNNLPENFHIKLKVG